MTLDSNKPEPKPEAGNIRAEDSAAGGYALGQQARYRRHIPGKES